MSGGYFNYAQYQIDNIADSLEEYINGYELDDVNDYLGNHYWYEDDVKDYARKHHHTMPNPCKYSDEVINEFRKGLDIIRKAAIYAQRIDWLLSYDDGEEEFLKRLKEELEEYDQRRS